MKKRFVAFIFLTLLSNLSAMEEKKIKPAEFDPFVQKKVSEFIDGGIKIGNLLPKPDKNTLLFCYQRMQEHIKKVGFTNFENETLNFYDNLINTIKEKNDSSDYYRAAKNITFRSIETPAEERLRSLAEKQWEIFRTNAQYFAQKEVEASSKIRFPQHFDENKTKKPMDKFTEEWFSINKDITMTDSYPVLLGSLLYFGYLYQVEANIRKCE